MEARKEGRKREGGHSSRLKVLIDATNGKGWAAGQRPFVNDANELKRGYWSLFEAHPNEKSKENRHFAYYFEGERILGKGRGEEEVGDVRDVHLLKMTRKLVES